MLLAHASKRVRQRANGDLGQIHALQRGLQLINRTKSLLPVFGHGFTDNALQEIFGSDLGSLLLNGDSASVRETTAILNMAKMG